LLGYFGETSSEPDCGGCDNCLSPRDTYDGTVPVQKFLSCVYRVRQQSGFDFGLNQVVEVLTGAQTDNVRRWNHEQLSTYGIGREYTRPQWKSIGRELIRLGYLSQASDKFQVVAVTSEGMAVLKQRRTVMLTRPVTSGENRSARPGEITCDEALFETLRQLRKRLADERSVPSYIIFSDVALRQMARDYPSTPAEFLTISGVGEKKLAEYGETFLAEIAIHLGKSPRQIFASSLSRPAPRARPAGPGDSVRDTLQRFQAGESPDSIAAQRGLNVRTIFGHLAEAVGAGETVDMRRFLTLEQQAEIEAAFKTTGEAMLTPVFEALGGRYSFDVLRLVRAGDPSSVPRV
jgi:ATP-dependent DNA helicase RecQ